MTIFTSSTYLPLGADVPSFALPATWRARIRRLFEAWGAAYANGLTRPC